MMKHVYSISRDPGVMEAWEGHALYLTISTLFTESFMTSKLKNCNV